MDPVYCSSPNFNCLLEFKRLTFLFIFSLGTEKKMGFLKLIGLFSVMKPCSYSFERPAASCLNSPEPIYSSEGCSDDPIEKEEMSESSSLSSED